MIQIDTETGKVKDSSKATKKQIIEAIGDILANPCLLKSVSKKKNICLQMAENPFNKSFIETKSEKPSDKAISFIKSSFKADETTNKKFVSIMTQAISDAANSRKIKGKLFYMNEVRRITNALIRSMNEYVTDTDTIIRLK